MKQRLIYDLDGTVSKLNNTYDFIYAYLGRRHPIRRSAVRWCHKILDALVICPYWMRRRTLLILQFWGLNKADLQEFFVGGYKNEFMQTLTDLGETLLETDNADAMLLTGCTEIPAKAIADIFGFGEVICTEFASRGGRITGIRRDTYGNLKKRYIAKGTERLVYYTDDLSTENELGEIVDEIIIVKWPSS